VRACGSARRAWPKLPPLGYVKVKVKEKGERIRKKKRKRKREKVKEERERERREGKRKIGKESLEQRFKEILVLFKY